jgi:hypothetical protein
LPGFFYLNHNAYKSIWQQLGQAFLGLPVRRIGFMDKLVLGKAGFVCCKATLSESLASPCAFFPSMAPSKSAIALCQRLDRATVG